MCSSRTMIGFWLALRGEGLVVNGSWGSRGSVCLGGDETGVFCRIGMHIDSHEHYPLV